MQILNGTGNYEHVSYEFVYLLTPLKFVSRKIGEVRIVIRSLYNVLMLFFSLQIRNSVSWIAPHPGCQHFFQRRYRILQENSAKVLRNLEFC